MNSHVGALRAGLSPVAVDTTSKRPSLRWKQLQEVAVDELTAAGWDRAGAGLGVVCGQVSGRLMCVDVEARFMPRLVELAAALEAAGLSKVFTSWIEGYSESTPSGGMHVLVRVEGKGPCPGNERFASDVGGGVLLESRGEGGYVVVAPSRNGDRGWELLSGGFDTIAWASWAEWSAVVAVLVGFDAVAPALERVAPAPRLEGVLAESAAPSWIDAAKAALPGLADVLEAKGWSPARSSDGYGQHWVRPGKTAREGHSASLSHESGLLWVHSTGVACLPTSPPSYDVVDVVLAYDLGRPPTLGERVEFLRGYRRVHPGGEANAATARNDVVVSSAAELNLPDEFWEQRWYLIHVRQAALARRLSPDAVWEGVKCQFAATIPWNHRLPDDGTMDYISIIVGASGAGKSRAKQEAYNLLEGARHLAGVALAVPIGSGEGMTEFFLAERNSASKYAFRGVNFYADEGKFLLDIASRQGNTTIQALKQLWSGELTGSVAATKERHRWLPPRDVRATCLIAATPDVAVRFLAADLTDEGLPQRVSWGWAHYPHGETRPEHPGPLTVNYFDQAATTGGPYVLTMDEALVETIDAAQLAASRGETGESYEGHAIYATLKTAAIHAHLDGRMHISDADWALALLEWEATRKIRTFLLNNRDRLASNSIETQGAARAQQRLAEDPHYLDRAAQAILRKITATHAPLSTKDIKKHLGSYKQRYGIHYRSALELAEQREWVVIHSDGQVERGPAAGGRSGRS